MWQLGKLSHGVAILILFLYLYVIIKVKKNLLDNGKMLGLIGHITTVHMTHLLHIIYRYITKRGKQK